MKPDTRERYGTLSRLLHWTMAVLVIWQALKLFDRINGGEHWVGQTLVPWHISIGTLIGVLIVVRIIWALRHLDDRPPPAPPPTLGMLARAGHVALYVGMVLLPVSGISIMVGNGYGLEAFGIQLVAPGAGIPWLVVGASNYRIRTTPPHIQGRAAAAMNMAFNAPQTAATVAAAAIILVLDYRILMAACLVALIGCAVACRPWAADRAPDHHTAAHRTEAT